MITPAVKAPEARKRPQDGLAVYAFLLALVVMVVPLEADLLTVSLMHRQFLHAGFVAMTCFAVVFTPFLISLRRRERESQARRGRGYLIATGIILALNVLFVGTILIYQFFR